MERILRRPNTFFIGVQMNIIWRLASFLENARETSEVDRQDSYRFVYKNLTNFIDETR